MTPRRASWHTLGSAALLGLVLGCGGREPVLERGEAAYREGDFGTALDIFQGAHDEALAAADSATAAIAMTWIGLAHWQLGEYESARAMGEEALVLKDHLGLTDELARSLNALGLLAWNEGRLADAMDLHGRSLRAATRVDDTSGVARALNNLALVHADLGELSVAGERYLEAREIFQRLGLADFEGRVLTNVGALQAERGDALAAERALREAFELYAEAEDPVGELNALGQLGVVYAAQGDPQTGLRYLDSALVVAQGLGLRLEEASNLEQLANIHESLGSHRLALDLFERADRINSEVGLPYEHGANLRARGAIQRELGNLELAADLIERALSVHDSIGAKGEVLVDLLELARVRQEQGRENEAAARFETADSLALGLESARARTEVALVRAELAEMRREPRAALEALASVEAEVRGVSVDRQWRWELLRARTLHALGSPDAASAAQRAVDLVEQIRASLRSRLLRGSVTQGRAETYHTLVEILLEAGRVDAAFEVSDAARGGDLARQVAMRGSAASGPGVSRLAAAEELLITIGYLDRSLDDWYGSTPPEARGAPFEAEVAALTAQRDQARLEYSRLLAQEDDGGPGLGLLGATRPTAREIRAALAVNEALIEYLVTDERLIAFVVRRERVHTFQFDLTEGALKSRLRVARTLAGDPEADPSLLEAVLSGLFDLLVRPAVESGALEGAGTLVFVPDGHLTYLPFAALYDRDGERHLVESHVLIDQPSASAWLALRRREADTPAGSTAGAGFAPFPNRLPASEEEVRRFADRHPGEMHVGPEATEGRLREALESGALVHAAAHGVMNGRNPLFSRLELRSGSGDPEDDGTLRVHEILEQRSRAPLLFLSACETGAGPAWTPGVIGGKDYAALSRGLLYAGARNVVATLWPVQDAAAALFTARFYDELTTVSVAEALARTQRATLAEDATSAPFFWAGYRITGEGTWSVSVQGRGRPAV